MTTQNPKTPKERKIPKDFKSRKKKKHKRGDHFFQVIKTIWPFKHGWGVYCWECKTLLEDGLTKERAQEICNEENQRNAFNEYADKLGVEREDYYV